MIKATKIQPLLLQVLITITLLAIVSFLYVIYTKSGFSSIDLLILCWINNIAFIIQIRLQREIFASYVNPISLFSVFLFLFSSGQLILYSMNIEIEGFNIFNRLDHTVLGFSVLYLISGYSFYQLGLFLAVSKKNIYAEVFEHSKVQKNNIVLFVGILFFTIGIIPYTIFLINALQVVLSTGYMTYYSQGARLSNIIVGLGFYVFPGLILIAVGGNKSHRKFSIGVLVFIAAIRLISGDRGDGIVYILSAYMIYIYFVQKNRPKIWQTLIVTIILMSFVPIIGTLRSSMSNELSSFGGFISILNENNIIISTLTNLGGTIWPLVKTMELIPNYQEYIFGGSYVVSVFLLIPSFLRFGFFSDIVSNKLYSSPANWLMESLSMTYGPGFTPFAEAYMNFGWFGTIFMVFFGYFITKLLSYRRTNGDLGLMIGLGILTFLLFAMGARGTFNYFISFYFKYVLIPYLLILIVNSRFRKKS